ncbi:hypothetical protein SAMN05216548_108141 [Faunimonas pinastri]|uniref:Uncharacterized protein n=1 Tax=Faunimonas pinastri TaxID=1855383 RepID=A0A1H9JJH0_9HYPH|nr:hypothetical protein [Faunimonas pinastri]SEQ86685.1 hypothetical protein SAMN05216548_108141 [Faunimonas pinastri]
MSETNGFGDYVRHEEEVLGEDTEGSAASTPPRSGSQAGRKRQGSGQDAAKGSGQSGARSGGQSKPRASGQGSGEDKGQSQQQGLLSSVQSDVMASARSQPLTTFFLAVLLGYIFGRLRILPF